MAHYAPEWEAFETPVADTEFCPSKKNSVGEELVLGTRAIDGAEDETGGHDDILGGVSESRSSSLSTDDVERASILGSADEDDFMLNDPERAGCALETNNEHSKDSGTDRGAEEVVGTDPTWSAAAMDSSDYEKSNNSNDNGNE